jgi:phage FluMu protein Com
MPIRFVCTHCGQKLSVGSHKAGQKANCPRCKETVRVPGETNKPAHAVAASMLVMNDPDAVPDAASSVGTMREEPAAPPIADEAPIETSELVFDTSSSAPSESSSDPGVLQRTDYNLVSFPRYVLYAQAGLIAGVALVCFTLGALMGAAFFRESGGPVAAKPCVISGYVKVTEGTQVKGDDGAVVIALPHNVESVEERSPVEGFRPRDTPPDDTDRGLLLLRNHGGNFAKADKQGKYQLRLPRAGKYMLLIISGSKTAPAGEVDAPDLRRIATFFQNANELIGTQKCKVISEERFVADRKFDVSFD